MAINAPATDLNAMLLKVRKITQLPSAAHATNQELADYINTFYLYDLPEHLRILNLKQSYNFVTQPNIDRYNFTPNTFYSIEPPVFLAGNEIKYSQDKVEFFTWFPDIQRSETLTTGTNIVGPYSGNITATPVKRNRILVSTVDVNGNPMSAQDSVAGTFVGDVAAGATINYLTGAIANLTWNNAVPNGENIIIQSIPYTAGRPYAMLFYQDQFQLNPVPDQAYEVQLNAYVLPTFLAATNSSPQLSEWWQLLSWGAALKIFQDKMDLENYQKARGFFDEALNLVERRTLKQLSNQRVSTIYNDWQGGYRNLFPSNQW